MEKNRIDEVTPILLHYGIDPFFVETVGNVKKIYSNKGVFGLKALPKDKNTWFIKEVNSLSQKGFSRYVPIYPTRLGQYTVEHEDKLYYLMPWLTNEIREGHPSKYEQMFAEIGRLHSLSQEETVVKKESTKRIYENTLGLWEQDEKFLAYFLDKSEKTTYPSPYQLTFMLHYQDFKRAISFSKTKFEEWYEKAQNLEKVRTVLIHGKFSFDHFLYDERGFGYFTNFEDTKRGSPIHDLLPIFFRALKTYPKRNEDCIKWFLHYEEKHPLRDYEKLLFLSYFSSPHEFVKQMISYDANPKKNERLEVEQLQKNIWYLKNTEYVIMRILEEEQNLQSSSDNGPN